MNNLLKNKQIIAASAVLWLMVASSGLSANDSISVNGERALNRIVSQATMQPSAAQRVADLKRSIAGARVIALPGNQGIAASEMVKPAPGARRTPVAVHSAAEEAATDWSLPQLEIEPLIDPTVFFFSFGQ